MRAGVVADFFVYLFKLSRHHRKGRKDILPLSYTFLELNLARPRLFILRDVSNANLDE